MKTRLAWALGLVSIFISALSLISVLAKADPAQGRSTLTVSELLNNISESDYESNPGLLGPVDQDMTIEGVSLYNNDQRIVQIDISPYAPRGRAFVNKAFVRFDEEVDAASMVQFFNSHVTHLRVQYYEAPLGPKTMAKPLSFVDENNQLANGNATALSLLPSAVTVTFDDSSKVSDLETIASQPRREEAKRKFWEWEYRTKKRIVDAAESTANWIGAVHPFTEK